MVKQVKRWSESFRHYEGEKPGESLVKWLNEPSTSPKFIEELLADAQTVFKSLEKYTSLRKIRAAQRSNKLPAEFFSAHEKLNETLISFTHAPQIDLHEFEFPDGERLSWRLVTDESPIALLSLQVKCILQLIDQNAILKVRRCAYPKCSKWFFRRVVHQVYCSKACRWKLFTDTPEFKKKRNAYMKENYHLHKSGKVK